MYGVAAAVVVLLAGCADDTGPGDRTVTSASPTAEPSTDHPSHMPTDESTLPTPTHEPTPRRTPDPTGRPETRELIGVPMPGVESGCLLLDGYLLLGGDRDLLASGQRVRVTGTVERDLATTCQQGIPFTVETVAPAG